MNCDEYAVRWTELDANGQPLYDTFSEWSCGCPKTWDTPEEAAGHAKDLREDPMDYMSNIVVVRRPVPDWEVVEVAHPGKGGELP